MIQHNYRMEWVMYSLWIVWLHTNEISHFSYFLSNFSNCYCFRPALVVFDDIMIAASAWIRNRSHHNFSFFSDFYSFFSAKFWNDILFLFGEGQLYAVNFWIICHELCSECILCDLCDNIQHMHSVQRRIYHRWRKRVNDKK